MAEGVTGSAVDSMSRSVEDLPNEIWLDIPGYNGRYMVSNYSRIKSIIHKHEVIIKKIFESGRYIVSIYPKCRSSLKKELCGRIVAKSFHREPEENEVLKYVDGNYLNDRPDNVEWITKKESVNIAIKKGLYPKGQNRHENNRMAILSKEEVIEIRRLKKDGKSNISLKDQFGVSLECIKKIVYNKTWKNI